MLPSIIRLAITEASKPNTRTIMIRSRLVCRAWRVLSSLFIYSFSKTSLLTSPRVVSHWQSLHIIPLSDDPDSAGSGPRSDRSTTRSTMAAEEGGESVGSAGKLHPTGLGCRVVTSQSGSETALSVMNLVRSTSQIVSRGA